jgi:hypothetical protein
MANISIWKGGFITKALTTGRAPAAEAALSAHLTIIHCWAPLLHAKSAPM